jgi:CBS domain containing-hemolysin-like protein
MLTLTLLGVVVLIAGSALLAGAEAAYFSLGRARLKDTAGGDRGGTAPLIERPNDLLITLLIAITTMNIGASALATMIAAELFGPHGVLVSAGAMVFLLTVFGEALPITLAARRPEAFSMLAGRFIAGLSWLLTPVRALFSAMTAMIVARFGRREPGESELSVEELRTLVDVGASEGIVVKEELDLIHKVLKLEDTVVRAIMVPRTDVFCLDVDTPTTDILPALREHLHSRVPVYEDTIDSIIGILYTKDLLRYLHGLPEGFDLREHLHPPYFVPESKRADALLRELLAKKLHLAVVVDEFGGTAGVVSLEDLLEELVGEIADEYDEPERLIQAVDETTYRVAGKLPIEEFNAATGLHVSDETYDTVGGWVLDLFGRVPRTSERLETPELSVTVEKVERTRVVEVLVTLGRPASGEEAA